MRLWQRFFVDVVELGGRSAFVQLYRLACGVMKRLVLKTMHAKATRTTLGRRPSAPGARSDTSRAPHGRPPGRLALASSLGAGAFAASLLHHPTIGSCAGPATAAPLPARRGCYTGADNRRQAGGRDDPVGGSDAAVELKEKDGVTPGLIASARQATAGPHQDLYVRMKKRAWRTSAASSRSTASLTSR